MIAVTFLMLHITGLSLNRIMKPSFNISINVPRILVLIPETRIVCPTYFSKCLRHEFSMLYLSVFLSKLNNCELSRKLLNICFKFRRDHPFELFRHFCYLRTVLQFFDTYSWFNALGNKNNEDYDIQG